MFNHCHGIEDKGQNSVLLSLSRVRLEISEAKEAQWILFRKHILRSQPMQNKFIDRNHDLEV